MQVAVKRTFVQILEGSDYTHAEVVALIDAPSVVQAVRAALAKFFQTPHVLTPPAVAGNGKPRSRTTYMRKYGKTLKAMAAASGLKPSVVSTRLRRGWPLKDALKVKARLRRVPPSLPKAKEA